MSLLISSVHSHQATATPWFSKGYVYKQQGTDVQCIQNQMYGWVREYCHDKMDNGCPVVAACAEGSTYDWRAVCTSCDKRKQLYDVSMSFMILALLSSVVPTFVSVMRACEKFQEKNRLVQGLAGFSCVCVVIAVVTFAALHPQVIKEDDKGSCGNGVQVWSLFFQPAGTKDSGAPSRAHS
jgi:hypothetical protein